MFIFVMKSRADRHVEACFRDLNGCVVILWNTRNNTYRLCFSSQTQCELSVSVFFAFWSHVMLVKKIDQAVQSVVASRVSYCDSVRHGVSHNPRCSRQTDTSHAWQLLEVNDVSNNNNNNNNNNSILYYLCTESTAVRPITDRAQCRYR
jgi:hypothetical protein